MEKITETWVSTYKKASSGPTREAYLVNIYPVSSAIGSRYLLSNRPLIAGRGEECDIRIQDNSVSRRHARIEPQPEGYIVLDLNSTNGTFVNDVQITSFHLLSDGDYVRIGNCIYRFLASSNVEAEYHEEIYRLTIMDALTQVHNHRYLMEFLDREIIRSLRHHRPLSLLMVDIDRFKAINDEMGHLGGDFALRELANVIRKTVRREDLFARYGGEEFALVLIESTLEQAVEVAERIRVMIEVHEFHFEDKKFKITVSLGASQLKPKDDPSPYNLIRRADENLLKAKRSGRNRVVADK